MTRANTTPETSATAAMEAQMPAMTQRPSRSSIASANMQMAMAGGILPIGMGRNSTIDSSKQRADRVFEGRTREYFEPRPQ